MGRVPTEEGKMQGNSKVGMTMRSEGNARRNEAQALKGHNKYERRLQVKPSESPRLRFRLRSNGSESDNFHFSRSRFLRPCRSYHSDLELFFLLPDDTIFLHTRGIVGITRQNSRRRSHGRPFRRTFVEGGNMGIRRVSGLFELNRISPLQYTRV